MNNKMILIGLVAIVTLWLTGCNGKENQNSDTRKGYPVKVQKVELSKENSQNYYVGIVEESVSVPVSFLTTGQVEKVYVTEGQKVKKGQLLAELNNSNYQSMYQMSLAKEKQADDAFNRLSELYKKGSLPEIKYIEIQTGVEQARSATQIALKNLNDCKLYAPMDGVIGMRSIESGMSIIPSVTVLKVVKIDKVYIKVSVPENEISNVKIGQSAKISVTALSNEQFNGSIEEKGVMANPLSHTYDIKISISNSEENLMPGMVSNVYLQNNATASHIVIPNNAIISGNNDKKFVFIVDKSGKTALKRTVLLGAITNSGIIVNEGLNQGELLIVEGYQKLSNNSPILINL